MSDKEENHGLSQAKAQLESIVEMVAALECDYDRLEELRDERKAIQDGDNVYESDDVPGKFGYTGCDADQYGSSEEAIAAELSAWDKDNGEELADLEKEAGDCESEENARERIHEDPLSVAVRSGWYTPGEEKVEAEEFEILLCTGGPAVRIRGELDRGQASSPVIQYQDWGTPWTEYIIPSGDVRNALETYCQQFWFGD